MSPLATSEHNQQLSTSDCPLTDSNIDLDSNDGDDSQRSSSNIEQILHHGYICQRLRATRDRKFYENLCRGNVGYRLEVRVQI